MSRNDPKLIERFSLLEKTLMRLGFYGLMVIGAYGIFIESTLWGFIYVAFVMIGLNLGLLYFLCRRCPYPYKHSDCLFVPFWVVKKQHTFCSAPMGLGDKIGFLSIMAGFVVIPQYWLFQNVGVLILFWIFCLPTIGRFVFYLCRRCQHIQCPLNRVNEKAKTQGFLQGA